MKGVPSTTNETYQCDSCLQSAHGYSWRELTEQGWKRHMERQATVTLCGECEDMYAQRRLDRAQGLAAT